MDKSCSGSKELFILDGGMGRELLRMGAPFRQPEWSALSLIEAPDFVAQAHRNFAAAGADVLTTSNYAVVPFHLGEKRFLNQGSSLTALSGQLAAEVAASYGCLVAGALPPLFGSYRPDLFQMKLAPKYLSLIIAALFPFVDLWLAETISSIQEAQLILTTLSQDQRPLWLSYTLDDGKLFGTQHPCLRSGEKLKDAVKIGIQGRVAAILFNCSQPESMTPAIKQTRELFPDLPLGVYANAFPALQKKVEANASIFEIRDDLDPKGYAHFAQKWHEMGVSIIGGCCGIGPEHIGMLKKQLNP